MASKKLKKGKCWRCKYHSPTMLSKDSEQQAACLYILLEGHRRPCPGGEECTVFMPRRGRRQPI